MRAYRAFMFFLRRRRQIYTAVGPPPAISNGILQESSLTDFIMAENGADYILQE